MPPSVGLALGYLNQWLRQEGGEGMSQTTLGEAVPPLCPHSCTQD